MYFKIFNEDDNHNRFQYKDGLNTDINEFKSKGSCIAGGLYFTDADNICEFLHYGDFIRVVEVSKNEAQVVQDGNKWRAKSLFLHPRKDLREVDTWKWMIKNNVDITVKNNYAVRWASRNGYLDIVKLLLKHGVDCTTDYNLAIRVASKYGHIDVVKLLLKNGAKLPEYLI